MIPVQNVKVVPIVCGTVNTATGTTAVIDRAGYEQADIVVQYGPQAGTATSSAVTLATFAVKHGDDTNLTSGSTIAGLVSGTDYTLPAHSSTAVEGVAQIHASVNGIGKGRYLKVSLKPFADTTAITNVTLSAVAILSRAAQAPDTTTERNVSVFAQG